MKRYLFQIGFILTELKGNSHKITTKSSDKIIKQIAGYVPQEDHLFQNLTVRETLNYYAALRLPPSLTSEQKVRNFFEFSVDSTIKTRQVELVIQELRLTHVADSKIGGEFVRGISGGEKRRVSIGLQLLTNPSKIFMKFN